jgi:formylglycine-generating enzyme required for sulfatase activity
MAALLSCPSPQMKNVLPILMLLFVGVTPPTISVTHAAAPPKQTTPVVGSPVTVPELNLKLVPVAAGKFTMGSPDNEQGRAPSEGPQTRVTLSKPFWLGATEVTQMQYKALMGNNPALLLKPRAIVTLKRPDLSTPNVGDAFPVFNVSWNDAMAFCQKLTERERAAGRLPTGYVYTLPTDAQWEYACRAGTTGPYAGKLDEIAWYQQNSRWTLHEVGTKKPNAWGLYDMHGNVKEWCLDYFKEKLPGGAVTDPMGPTDPTGPPKDQVPRVYRGGFWGGSGKTERSAYRMGTLAKQQNWDVGFRIALAPQIIPTSRGK